MRFLGRRVFFLVLVVSLLILLRFRGFLVFLSHWKGIVKPRVLLLFADGTSSIHSLHHGGWIGKVKATGNKNGNNCTEKAIYERPEAVEAL